MELAISYKEVFMLKKIWKFLSCRNWKLETNEAEAEMLGLWFTMINNETAKFYDVIPYIDTEEPKVIIKVQMRFLDRIMYYMDFYETKKQTWERKGSWL